MTLETKISRDLTGIAYGRPAPTYNKELVEVGPGKPMGEYMRRYWHPIAIAAELKDLPHRVRILGEDLVVFRDGQGRVGALYERCAHRQASLFFGRIEDDGIRCCYHGWKFDVEGRCLQQPLETDGGKCALVRQPWYPVEEHYGLIWIYMGPADKIPLLPRYDCMEPLEPGEYYAHGFESLPGSVSPVLPTSWLIDQDNIHDMGHALWLHQLHSGPQFGPAFDYVTMENAAYHQNFYDYIETEQGIYSRDEVTLPDGSVVESCLETHMPNVRFINPPVFIGQARLINWCVPVDDGSHYTISLARVKADGVDMTVNPMSHWDRSDPEVVQRTPSDNEAQNSQGPIEFHSEEHLVPSDRGVVKLRRQYQRELKALAAGQPLMAQRFPGQDPVFPVKGGAYLLKAAPDRPFPEASSASAGETVDIGGAWILAMKTPMGEQKVNLTLASANGALTGEMIGPDGEPTALFDGRLAGDRAIWKTKLTKPMPMTVAFDVTLKDGILSGTFKAGMFPAGPVTATRG